MVQKQDCHNFVWISNGTGPLENIPKNGSHFFKHWKTEHHWKTEKTPTIGILKVFGIPAPNDQNKSFCKGRNTNHGK